MSNKRSHLSDLIGAGEQGMIQRALEKKLRKTLAEGWSSEAQVVYFLVTLRKLVEGFGDPVCYSTNRLKFFCDWALHPLLDRSSAVAQLEYFDKVLGATSMEAFYGELERSFKLEHFRDDIIHQLLGYHLSVEPINTMRPWIAFLRLYLAVVTNSPILERQDKLTHIDRLQVSVEEREPEELPRGSAYVFTILWTFQKRRKVVLEWKNQLVCPLNPKLGAFYQLSGRPTK